MKASNACIALVKRFEGLSLKPYKCPAGVWTIGYGHTDNVPGDPISEPKAEQLLRLDLEDAEKAVNHADIPNLSQPQFDALVSFVFNVGTGNFKKSTLLKCALKGDSYGVYKEFGKWNKATVKGKLVVLAGLTARRAAEASLYLSGVTYTLGESGVIPDGESN